MKLKNIFKGILAFATLSAVSSCADLDLQPLTEPSSDTWNSNMDEVRISLNDLYRTYPYQLEIRWFTDGHTDDFCHRNKVYDCLRHRCRAPHPELNPHGKTHTKPSAAATV